MLKWKIGKKLAFDWEKITEKFALSERKKKEKIFFLHISFSLFGVFAALMKIQKSYIFKGWKFSNFFSPFANLRVNSIVLLPCDFGFGKCLRQSFSQIALLCEQIRDKNKKIVLHVHKKNNIAHEKLQSWKVVELSGVEVMFAVGRKVWMSRASLCNRLMALQLSAETCGGRKIATSSAHTYDSERFSFFFLTSSTMFFLIF